MSARGKRALVPRDDTGAAPIPAPPADLATPPAIEVTTTPGETGTGTGVPPRPQPWAGWPSEWPTPYWHNARLEELTDVAWSCLDKNSAIVAAMPPYLVNAAPSLDAAWLTNPDPRRYNGWWDFMRQAVWEFIGLGEVVIMATAFYKTGFPARFHTIPPYLVDIELASDGSRRYKIGNADVTDLIVHVPYQATTQSPRGTGPLVVGRGRLIAANLLGRYVTNLMSAGGVPTTALVHPGELTAAQIADLQNQWVTARMSTMGLPAVLSGGITYQPTGVSPRDLALTELANMTEARIAVLLRVPPHMMALPSAGDSLTYTSPGQTTTWHWRVDLRPIVRPLMEALSNWALPIGTSIELNRDDYIKPEPVEEAQMYATLVAAGIMTVEEVRLKMRLDVAVTNPTQPVGGVLQ